MRSTDRRAAWGSSDRRGRAADSLVAIAAQGVTGEHDSPAMQPDAARRVAGHVHHLPPGHLVAIVQQQVRSDRADPEHPADHLLNRAALGRQLTASQHRRVQLVDRHATPVRLRSSSIPRT